MKAALLLLAILLVSHTALAQSVTSAAGPNVRIFQDGTGWSTAASTGEQNLVSVKIPAGSMGANGSIRITSVWTNNNSGNNKNLTIRWATTQGAVSGGAAPAVFTVTTTQGAHLFTFIRNKNATNSQVYGTPGGSFGALAAASSTSAIDTTADTWVNFNVNLANSGDTATLVGYTIEIIKQ